MKHRLTIISLLFSLFILVWPVAAQDSTAEATPAATSEVTQEATVEATPAPSPVVTVNTGENSITSGIVLILGVLATGMIAISLGLQVIGNRAKQISDNPVAVAALEQGYETFPDAIKEATKPLKESLERSDDAIKNLIELVKKLTDGVPEASKPVDPSPNAHVPVSTGGAGGGAGSNQFTSTSTRPMPPADDPSD